MIPFILFILMFLVLIASVSYYAFQIGIDYGQRKNETI